MVVLLKENPEKQKMDVLIGWLESSGLDVHVSAGLHQVVLGLIGDTSCLDMDLIRSLDIVEDVKRISEPYRNANRKFHPQDSIFEIGSTKIGGGHFQVIAGPCSVESAEQICEVAHCVKEAGATMLRGGAFKPRTSP